MKVASLAAHAWRFTPEGAILSLIIAHSIMAERERCASIILAHKARQDFLDTSNPLVTYDPISNMLDKVAAAIRTPS